MKRYAWLFALAALAVPGPVQAAPAPAKNIRLTVLHTNDIHGWIMPRPAAFYAANPSRSIGGVAALVAYVKKAAGPKLILDAGDWFQGTPEGGLRDGRVMADVFNMVGYDALEVGNHDFDNGERNLQHIIKAIKPPVLCANVYREGRRVPECRPWIIKEVAGVKVGIFGLLTANMKALAFPDNIAGLTFRREVDEAKDAVAALRGQGATVIIALTHVGLESPAGPPFEGDQALAAQVEGIDLIVGGHSHTALPEGLRDAAHGTLIVQAGSELTRVGEVALEIDPATKKVVKSSARLVDLWPDETGSDPAADALVAGLSAEVKPIYDVVLATAAQALVRSRDGESALGDWMTDCERDWAGADLALQNGGGIRVDIPAGPVTFRQIFDIMPFNNRVVKFVMKGKDVRALLDHGLAMGHIAQVSGARLSYHRQAAEGKRLETVDIAGRPLRDDSTYTVATIDFLALGGDGYTAFAAAGSKDFTKTLLRDVLKRCAQKERLIQAPPAGRLAPLGD
jgi:2',3'-cyclic-nucleotide 2'-phosphodiesterase (5'-nucleotidase family)